MFKLYYLYKWDNLKGDNFKGFTSCDFEEYEDILNLIEEEKTFDENTKTWLYIVCDETDEVIEDCRSEDFKAILEKYNIKRAD